MIISVAQLMLSQYCLWIAQANAIGGKCQVRDFLFL